MRRIGIDPSTALAVRAPHWVSKRPVVKLRRPMPTVQFSCPWSRVSARMNSLYVPMNCSRKMKSSIGTDTGRMIRKKAPQRDAPSTIADSSSAGLTDSRYPLKIQAEKAIAPPEYARIRPVKVLSRSSRTISQ